jgi:hypothetical protein
MTATRVRLSSPPYHLMSINDKLTRCVDTLSEQLKSALKLSKGARGV